LQKSYETFKRLPSLLKCKAKSRFYLNGSYGSSGTKLDLSYFPFFLFCKVKIITRYLLDNTSTLTLRDLFYVVFDRYERI
jgi:hypothetical protein